MLDTFVNPVIESVNSLFPEIMQSHSWLFYLKEQSFDLNLWTDKIFHMIFFFNSNFSMEIQQKKNSNEIGA